MRQKEYHLEAANLPGRKYMEDKPKDCAYCYWWRGGKKGCARDSCYYLLPPDEENPAKEKTAGECRNCPYGKHSPCIGYCIDKIFREHKKPI